MKYTYLLVDFTCIIVPFIASFYPKHPFYKEWKYFFPANIIVALFFITWDMIFTERGVWGFNPEYLTGYNIINLPIEEVLFFVCIPYCCVFTYFALKYLVKNIPLKKAELYLKLVILIASLFFMTAGFGLDYTFFTGLFTALYMLGMFYFKTRMNYTFLTYFLIVPFFLLSNGLLTGYFTDAPVVWYNAAENIGFRIFTIPVEDSLYGFLMIAMSIGLYDLVKNYYTKEAQSPGVIK